LSLILDHPIKGRNKNNTKNLRSKIVRTVIIIVKANACKLIFHITLKGRMTKVTIVVHKVAKTNLLETGIKKVNKIKKTNEVVMLKKYRRFSSTFLFLIKDETNIKNNSDDINTIMSFNKISSFPRTKIIKRKSITRMFVGKNIFSVIFANNSFFINRIWNLVNNNGLGELLTSLIRPIKNRFTLKSLIFPSNIKISTQDSVATLYLN